MKELERSRTGLQGEIRKEKSTEQALEREKKKLEDRQKELEKQIEKEEKKTADLAKKAQAAEEIRASAHSEALNAANEAKEARNERQKMAKQLDSEKTKSRQLNAALKSILSKEQKLLKEYDDARFRIYEFLEPEVSAPSQSEEVSPPVVVPPPPTITTPEPATHEIGKRLSDAWKNDFIQPSHMTDPFSSQDTITIETTAPVEENYAAILYQISPLDVIKRKDQPKEHVEKPSKKQKPEQ
jgi:chromosome segregation ATPase